MIAPCLAMSSPVLKNAIFALAALHLSHIANHEPLMAVHYHDRCIQAMVPMLDDGDQIKDDALLLTSMILALYEDLDYGADSQRHIFGTSLFLPAQGICLSSRLRRAVFWAHLRQEIYAACSQQCTVRANFDHCDFDSTLIDPAEDYVWVHRALWICALVVQWAFGDECTSTRWRELEILVEEWERTKPQTFTPIFFRERDPLESRWFPEVCYATDEHVTGTQFIILAKILLTTHNPTLPRIGPKMKIAVATMQANAIGYVRFLCGQGLHNRFVPACFHAMLALRICGSLFEDLEEQRHLLSFLQFTEERSGWPKAKAERALMDEWGWDVEVA